MVSQKPADQAQSKWLVFTQCTWGQWNPTSLCDIIIIIIVIISNSINRRDALWFTTACVQ